MNLQVPPELEAKLTRLAAETGRTADQVALDLLASSVDHDEWFRAEVEKGRAAAREGRLIELPHLGRPGRVHGTREVAFPPLPFIAIYEV
jgi:predicted transcriptional regulator